MKLTLPIGSVDEVLALADALDAAARSHRAAAIGAAEALDQDRRDGEPIPAGAADQVLAALARAGILERLGTAARRAHAGATAAPADADQALAAALQQLAAQQAAAQAATPVFLPPAPPTAPAPAATDPESEQVDIFAPGAIT